jgi:hypothetical protein
MNITIRRPIPATRNFEHSWILSLCILLLLPFYFIHWPVSNFILFRVLIRVADLQHFNADLDSSFHFYAYLDPTFHFTGDPDPDPDPASARHQNNLQPLVYRPPWLHEPQRASLWATTALHVHCSILSLWSSWILLIRIRKTWFWWVQKHSRLSAILNFCITM